jgi:hypothetical protein
MCEKDRYSSLSSVVWMCGSDRLNSDSMTNDDGYPNLDALAWSEQA